MRAKGDVLVFTGPVFGPDKQAIRAHRVRIPTHLLKLVYEASTGTAWAWQPNSADARAGASISYGELKQHIGMELLPWVKLR